MRLIQPLLLLALLIWRQGIKPLAPTAMPPIAPDLKNNAKEDEGYDDGKDDE